MIYYCLDTSFLINGWHKRYRRSVFTALWDALDLLIHDGAVFSCYEVFEELKKQEDDLLDWAKRRRDMFKDPDENVLKEMRTIMSSHPNIAAAGGSLNKADPWTIAQAKVSGAILVTDEEPAPRQRPTKPPRIPDVCEALGIPWMSPIHFFEHAEIRWTQD